MNRKPIFDAVRELLGRPFTQGDVDKLDKTIDQAEASPAGNTPPGPQPDPPQGARSLGMAGMNLIKSFEGCAKSRADGRFDAYPDPGTGGDPWTIGWGSTGQDIAKGLIWTQAECDERFHRDLQRYADEVSHAIGDAATTQNQFDALVSFHYNTGAIATATLTSCTSRVVSAKRQRNSASGSMPDTRSCPASFVAVPPKLRCIARLNFDYLDFRNLCPSLSVLACEELCDETSVYRRRHGGADHRQRCGRARARQR